MNALELTGRASTHIVDLADRNCRLHKEVVEPFLALCAAAATDEIDLVAASSFRDFERQLSIWNGKFRGERPVYDMAGEPLAILEMTPEQRVDAILVWSAVPGASRHHWGTDVDLIDRAALEPGMRVELSQAEYAAGGPFARLSKWLSRNAARHDFFRPFRGALSGVAPEPWHYSYAAVAEPARRALTAEVLREALATSPLDGKEFVLSRLAELHDRFVLRIDPPMPRHS
jgi:LAS superfamily LD-carboxypeptidase LdcB